VGCSYLVDWRLAMPLLLVSYSSTLFSLLTFHLGLMDIQHQMETKFKTQNLFKVGGMALFTVLIFTSCNFDKKYKKIGGDRQDNKYFNYERSSNVWIDTLSEKGKKLRADALAKLEATETYLILVDSNKVSSEYLPVLDAINYGIKSSFLNNSNKEMFEIDEEKVNRVENSQNGEDKMRFVINSILLSFKNKGGFPKELVDMFENYRKEFKYFGTPSKFYNPNGRLVSSVDYEYDLTAIFGILAPTKKEVLNKIQKAREENISDYFSKEDDKEYIYSYLATAEGYLNHLKENYQRSIYLPDDYNDDFWNNYDSEVNSRILKFILIKDCKALQKEFDIADKNMESQLAREGKGNLKLMNFINSSMEKIDCFE